MKRGRATSKAPGPAVEMSQTVRAPATSTLAIIKAKSFGGIGISFSL
jgi:hypothetical protein